MKDGICNKLKVTGSLSMSKVGGNTKL